MLLPFAKQRQGGEVDVVVLCWRRDEGAQHEARDVYIHCEPLQAFHRMEQKAFTVLSCDREDRAVRIECEHDFLQKVNQEIGSSTSWKDVRQTGFTNRLHALP